MGRRCCWIVSLLIIQQVLSGCGVVACSDTTCRSFERIEELDAPDEAGVDSTFVSLAGGFSGQFVEIEYGGQTVFRGRATSEQSSGYTGIICGVATAVRPSVLTVRFAGDCFTAPVSGAFRHAVISVAESGGAVLLWSNSQVLGFD